MNWSQRRTVEMLGLRFDALTEQGAADVIVGEIGAGNGGQAYAANLDVLRLCNEDRRIRDQVLRNANLLVADGTPLIWASRISGDRLPERVAGSTMLFTLSRTAAAAGASIFLLGGNAGTAEQAAERLKAEFPGLRVAGCYYPPLAFENDRAEMQAIGAKLAETQPDVVYVGLPFEKQVAVMPWLSSLLPRAWIMGVGVSFSFASGEIVRAPRWLQRFGLEWLHRLVQEPRRLARRYLLQGPPTLAVLFGGAIRQRIDRSRTGSAAS